MTTTDEPDAPLPGVVADDQLTHDPGCTVLAGADHSDCSCGAWAGQQMIRLHYVLARRGIPS